MLAEHVIGQVDPDWKSNNKDENQALKNCLSRCFKLTRDCKVSNDLTYFRISPDKKIEVQVQSIKNLTHPGILTITKVILQPLWFAFLTNSLALTKNPFCFLTLIRIPTQIPPISQSSQ